MTPPLSAHEASRPLLSLLNHLEGHPIPQIAKVVAIELAALRVADELDAVIVFSDGHPTLTFDAVTDYGKALLEELVLDEEPYNCGCGKGECEWCGVLA